MSTPQTPSPALSSGQTAVLQQGDIKLVTPKSDFLRLENGKAALEEPLFDLASTGYQIGARLISIPPNQAFARHIHPNAYHFIFVQQGTAILEYDSARYILQPGGYCLVMKGVVHKLGAGPKGLLAVVVNSPTYDNGDPSHVTYFEAETLESVESREELEELAETDQSVRRILLVWPPRQGVIVVALLVLAVLVAITSVAFILSSLGILFH